MADRTKIEWTDATVNAVNGCSVVSPGCTNCYAMKLAGTRMRTHPSRAGLTKDTKAGPVWTGELRLAERQLMLPLAWKRPRRIFWNAHGDLFHPAVPDAWIDRCFAVMALTRHHTHQVLTKRADRMRTWANDPATPGRVIDAALFMRELPDDWRWPLPNVWLGVSVEDQQRADERIPHLLATPAAVRFLSCEPLLGPVDLKLGGNFAHVDPAYWGAYHARLRGLARPHGRGAARGWADADMTVRQHPELDEAGQGIRWVIVGGESGPNARPMHPAWARSLRDQCAAAGVAFHFKQWGEHTTAKGAPGSVAISHVFDDGFQMIRPGKARAGRLLDGVTHDGFPQESTDAA